MIQLTEEQQRALDEAAFEPLRFLDPRTNEAYVMIPADDYEAVREALEEERRQEAIHRTALQNAARRMQKAP
jgi:PHD/YefM family antitoxin component YafN of YafNO toxin-antitoxin module